QVCELGLIVVEGQQQTDLVADKSCSQSVEDRIEPVEPLIPPSDTHPASNADQGNTIPEMMKVNPALHHNRIGKQGCEQSRANETEQIWRSKPPLREPLSRRSSKNQNTLPRSS